MSSVSEATIDFNDFLAMVFRTVCNIGCEYVSEMLQQWDNMLAKSRDKNIYRNVGIRVSSIKTPMGEITYSRRYYRKTDPITQKTEYVFLLDEYLGLDQMAGKCCEALAELATHQFMNTSCRKSARAITESTNITLSHAGVCNLFKATAGKFQKRVEQLAELDKEGKLAGEIQSRVLFTENDGVWISMQGADRPKGNGKRELKVATAYTGWRKIGPKHYETVNKTAYASFESPADFKNSSQTIFTAAFDMDGVERIIASSDAGGWCETLNEDADIDQLDPFHRSQAIIRNLPDKNHRQIVQELLGKKDIKTMLSYIEALTNTLEDPREVNKAKALLSYFTNNRDRLLTWEERGIELPEPPEGIVYRSLGVQEHSNASIICSRMKHHGASWTREGGQRMALMLSLRVHGGDPEWINDNRPIRKEAATVYPQPISSAKAPEHDGQGYEGGLRRGGWPYAGASTTIGRKRIREIFEQRPISMIRYQG